MGYLKILIGIYFLQVLTGCKKDISKASLERDEFSFTFNGQNYNYSITGNIANAGVGKGLDGTPFIIIDMINVFGGRIHFEKTGCAYFVPEFMSVGLSSGCILSTVNSVGNAVPVDSIKVFRYQSGSLDVPFTNCVRKSGVDFVTGLNYEYNVCTAIGTFDLTLVNNSNATIKITNGIVKSHRVIVP